VAVLRLMTEIAASGATARQTGAGAAGE
jgi:hypothetical protein